MPTRRRPTWNRRRTGKVNALRRRWHGSQITVSARTFRLLVNAWGLVIGFISVAGAISFFTLPSFRIQDTSVGHQLGPLEDAWTVMYGVAGLLILYGLTRDRRGADACGLVLMATSTLINFVAIALTLGARSTVVAAQLLGVTVGAVARALIIADVVHLHPDETE